MEHSTNPRITRCGICQSTEHNRRTCPQRLINDTFIREEQDYIEETIEISDNKEALIKHLLEREALLLGSQICRSYLRKSSFVAMEM